MRFLLDEDLPRGAAAIARGLGLDVASVHDHRRLGLPDEDQLRYAARGGRIYVTRNRDHFLRLTVAFAHAGEPHMGVWIVPRRLPNTRPEAIAHALARWAAVRTDEPVEARAYRIEFLS